MKTLSTNQVKQIEDFLITQYNIKYQDTRDEVIDHIACEIEELMTSGYEYRTAFQVTFDKWNKHLRPHSWIRYNDIPTYLARQWFKRDIMSVLLAMTIGLGFPYLFKDLIEKYSLANIIGGSICLANILLGAFLLTSYFGSKGYRVNQLKKDTIGCAAISLFFYTMFIGNFTYKLLPLPVIMMLYQIYYIAEIRKTKSYKPL
ncbi:hypothetical protein [Myroides pelagicus]|uniref:Uncharacterized protein n=1 Tax=Myroides pelagicus TaxID=270914 RepID=A0A7K1GMI1_9FLAO|nr:hypothetical protein [Myroides pelagicus]MEC4113542.1 hypothetical protein [Myroides pelagicus]MTH30066.1 hypothetical protein [Myroides pelagicus]